MYNCILFIRGMHPFYCTKFTLEKHKNYKYSADANDDLAYKYDPAKYGAVVAQPKDEKEIQDAKAIEEAIQGRDVNPERIRKEKEEAAMAETGEVEVSKNGRVCNTFVPIEETAEELQNSETPVNITLEAAYDSGYEFRTTKSAIVDIFNLNLAAEEEGQMLVDEPEDFDEPTLLDD